MPKKSSNTFEESLEKLEDIIDQMESDQLPLEELIAKYEEGNTLRKQCEQLLLSAKKRLETLKDSTSTSSTTAIDTDDEIRLF